MLSVVEASQRPFDYAQGDMAFNVPNKTKISLLYLKIDKCFYPLTLIPPGKRINSIATFSMEFHMKFSVHCKYTKYNTLV